MTSQPLVYTLLPRETEPHLESYGAFDGPVPPHRLPEYLPKGSLVAIRPHLHTEWLELAEIVEQVANIVANAPLLLWLDCVGRRRAATLAASGRLLGVRALAWRCDPPASALRSQLTDPLDWPESVVRWIRRRRFKVSLESAEVLRVMAGHATAHPTFSGLASDNDLSRGKARRALRAAGIGSPGQIHGILRAVAIGLALQRQPERTLAEFALDYRFSGANALSDRLYEIIGARPTFIRYHLGGQWMLNDAMKRMNIM